MVESLLHEALYRNDAAALLLHGLQEMKEVVVRDHAPSVLEEGLAGGRFRDGIIGGQKIGDDHHTAGSSRNNLRQIRLLDSSDTENWEADSAEDLMDLIHPDRRVIGLGGRGKERAESEIIGQLGRGYDCLFQGVGRFPHEGIRPSVMASLLNGHVILTDMGAVRPGFPDKGGMIVDDKGDAGFPAQRDEMAGHPQDGIWCVFFGP